METDGSWRESYDRKKKYEESFESIFQCPMIFISNIDPPLLLNGFENRVLIVNAVNESGITYLILNIKNLTNLIRFR